MKNYENGVPKKTPKSDKKSIPNKSAMKSASKRKSPAGPSPKSKKKIRFDEMQCPENTTMGYVEDSGQDGSRSNEQTEASIREESTEFIVIPPSMHPGRPEDTNEDPLTSNSGNFYSPWDATCKSALYKSLIKIKYNNLVLYSILFHKIILINIS